MRNGIAILEIVIGWAIIFAILNYMIKDGLLTELKHLIRKDKKETSIWERH